MLNSFQMVVGKYGGLGPLLNRAIRQPATALTALGRLMQADWPALVLPNPHSWAADQQELLHSGVLLSYSRALDEAFKPLKGQTIRGRYVVGGGVSGPHAKMLWSLIRQRRPRVIVETGVCNGLSSAIILEALARNGSGRLVSIDLPEFNDPSLNETAFWEGKGGAVVPSERPVGWLVPPALRTDWTLLLGRSQELLVPTLKAQAPVDMFIHDSEHSYANQMFEFTEAYEALAPGGLLVATDINWSGAFDDFWAKIRGGPAKRVFVDASCGLILKPGAR